MMNLKEAIAILESQIPDPRTGLPLEVFLFASGIVPMVNVDLLVKDEDGRTLLAWRDDPYAGTGWHVPGGVVRYKEMLETRIHKVAQTELGTEVTFDPVPIDFQQFILPEQKTRGHFLSFLYRCRVAAGFVPANHGLADTDPGYLAWHQGCPDDILPLHNIYRRHMESRPILTGP